MKRYMITVATRIKNDIKKYHAGICVFLIYYLVTHFFFNASCPALLLTGFPCPGCGLTRAVICVFTFRWESAFYLNPVAFLIALEIVLFVIYRYFLGKTKKIFVFLVYFTVALLIIRYIYGMINWYPNRIPYVFRSKNLNHYLIHLHQ